MGFSAGKIRHPLYRRLGGPRDRCRVLKIPPSPTGIKRAENDLIKHAAVGRKPFWIDENTSSALGI
jgi:hypothetical protein